MVIPAGTKDPCPADDRWAGTFSPGNAEANANLGHRSKVCSLVVALDQLRPLPMQVNLVQLHLSGVELQTLATYATRVISLDLFLQHP